MKNFVHDIVEDLKFIDVDGETMELILDKVGMREQMLRQLVMKADMSDLLELIEEKKELEEDLGPEYDSAGFTEDDRIVNGQYRVIINPL